MLIKINRYKILVVLIILIGPILDLFIGYFQRYLRIPSFLTPGIIYRGFLLIPLFVLLTFRIRTSIRGIFLYFMYIFVMANIVYLISGYEINLLNGLQRYLKILFPFIGVGALLYLDKISPDNKNYKFLWGIGSGYGLIIALSILLFFISGTGLQTYRQANITSKAFFPQNSAGLSLLITFPFLLYYIYTYKRNNIVILLSTTAIFFSSALLLGTRAAIIGIPFTFLLYFLFITFNRKYTKNMQHVVYRFIILLVILSAGFLIYMIWSQQGIEFIIYKFQLLQEGDFRRNVPLGREIIGAFSIADHLFGIGDSQFPLTENDLVDTYGKFGLLTLIPLILILLFFFISLLKIFINKRTLSTFLLIISFSFYLIHASLAGHAFIDALANNIIMLVYFLGLKEIFSYQQEKQSLSPHDTDRESFPMSQMKPSITNKF